MINQSWVITTGLSDFYIDNAITFFVNTKLDYPATRYYEYWNLEHKLNDIKTSSIAIIEDTDIRGMGICYPVDYLSEYFGARIGVIDGLVIDKKLEKYKKFEVADNLIEYLLPFGNIYYDFLSANVPSDSLELIQALENHGFYYAEGFNNMVGRVLYEQAPWCDIREAEESDFPKIEQSYLNSDFPSRLVTDSFFDEKKSKQLYVQNFRHTWESNLGKVWVAEINGDFAGALIGKIDKQLEEEIGIVTNARAGMGIIVDPKHRNYSVASDLLATRDNWYRNQGVTWQILGANISNVPMIRLLEKRGFHHASTTITMHKKL